MAGDRGNPRWLVSYTATIPTPAAEPVYLNGELFLRQEIARLVLLDAEGSTIDARYLHADEVVIGGAHIEFPAHRVRILRPVIPVAAPVIDSAALPRRAPSRARDGDLNGGVAAEIGSSPLSPPATATGLHGAEVVTGDISGERPPGLDLDSLFAHFWSSPRVSPPPISADSFGWWLGKVGGDHRSFAQVLSSPSKPTNPTALVGSASRMGDRGGRNFSGGRRGGSAVGGAGGRNPNPARTDGGNRNLIWQRDEGGGGGGNNSSDGGSTRWDAAAAAQGSGKDKAPVVPASGSRSTQLQQHHRVERKSSPGDVSCLNCGSNAHFSARCPTIRCERCGKLGHINQICQAILLWECVASMCGFQQPGQGFFYFHDSSSARQVKDRASSLVITILEGNPTSRDLEKEFNEYLGSGWRCTARPMNSKQYTMRFPSAKEVDKAVFYGRSMEMKTFDVVINLSPWPAAIGASGMLNKAWVRVRNIPTEKRCDANAAYAGSLVGVTLEVHQATLHKPEYCRILLGCRDIDKIAETAEGVLGDFFYIFAYEVESIVVQGPPVVRNAVTVANSSTPSSPKRARTETYSVAASDASTGGFMSGGWPPVC
ncbi:hypothetical protein ACQ4PT_051894 [Festuca glaucescens]